MTAYEAAEWSDLFVASTGGAAALAGLLFVAVSINIDRILRFEGLPDRALQVLLQLLGVVVFSVLALAPGQSPTALGIELLVVALPLLIGSVALTARSSRAAHSSAAWLRQLVVVAGTAPFVVGAVSLIAESGGGLYWLLAGTVLALIGAVLNAWVLLVEILR